MTKPLSSATLIKVGGQNGVDSVLLGGGHPVVIQTMWKEALTSESVGSGLSGVLERIEGLARLGCGILRFAVPDMDQAERLGFLSSKTKMPLVADIHFDYRLALRCLDFPIAKIRINPGNIGARDKVKLVVEKARDRAVPLRIGVNAGSLPSDLAKAVNDGTISRSEALVSSAERELAFLDELGFKQVLVSLKASSITDTVAANRSLFHKRAVPLHLGVTEAGPLIAGVVRNAIALHSLLDEGIGDTLRVSLSDSMENEIIAGREILGALADTKGNKPKGVVLVSCPRCGRNGFDVHGFIERWRDRLYSLNKDVTIAVMGCVVNGPGEARHADLGITGAGDKVLIFRQGAVVRTLTVEEADAAFEEELKKL